VPAKADVPPTGVYHVQLRQFPHVTREFNLDAAALRSRILAPWLAGRTVESGDRRWAPERARLTIYEGRALRPDEIGMGRGWANVTRTGEDVTARLLTEAEVETASGVAGGATAIEETTSSELQHTKELILAAIAAEGGLELRDCVGLAGAPRLGARASERLALAEQAAWELLHAGTVRMTAPDGTVAPSDWQRVLLDWEAWSGRGPHRIRLVRG
jgi:hypothetical protein